jgi:hypothetical protein
MLVTLAQTTQPLSDLQAIGRLGSISAIVIATMFVVHYVIKPAFSSVPGMSRLPILAYVVTVAAALVVLANRGLKTLPGDNLPLLMWDAVLASLAASGLYNAIPVGSAPSSLQSIGSTAQPKMPGGPLPVFLIILALLGAGMTSGCAAIANSPLGKMFTAKAPTEKVAAAEQTYTIFANSLADSIRKGLITDVDTLKSIKKANGEIQAALDAAKALAQAGDKDGFTKLWPTVRDRLDKFLLDYAGKQQRKAPTTKEVSWIPSPSRSASPSFAAC